MASVALVPVAMVSIVIVARGGVAGATIVRALVVVNREVTMDQGTIGSVIVVPGTGIAVGVAGVAGVSERTLDAIIVGCVATAPG